MSDEQGSLVIRLVDRVFPRMPDFFGLITEQCDVVCKGLGVYVEYMETGDKDKAAEVRRMEKTGDELKARNITILNRAFSTPMDREDIYRAISNVDQLLNYAKTTVRELEVLELRPDPYMLEMAVLMKDGADALYRGFCKLSKEPALAEEDAQAAHKTERTTEKVYRRALACLFNPEEQIKMLHERTEGAEVAAMMAVIDIFKRREIYRHMSNGADTVAWAAQVLHDIVVKIA
jgi:hypothetical protein